MRTLRWLLVACLMLVGAPAWSQARPDVPGPDGRVFEGPHVRIGHGVAYTRVRTDGAGTPVTIGIVLTAGVLDGLPKPHRHRTDFAYPLAMPRGVATAVDHVVVDWEAAGHPPPHVYDVPHFDFHFYLITQRQRMRIHFRSAADSADPAQRPPAAMLPAGYVLPPGTAVSRMGVHAVDPAAPEFHGQPFRSTFIYGYDNRRLAFYEPMASLAFLRSRPSMTAAVARPAMYPKPGLYPSSYAITYDTARNRYEIILSDLKP